MQADRNCFPKVAIPTRYNRGLSVAIFAVLIFLPVFAVFVDMFAPPLGGYADQRIVLCGTLIGLVLLSAAISYRHFGVCIRVFRAWPLILFSFSFVLLSVPYIGQNFVWVEPGLYALYFMTVAVVGAVLVEGGMANKAIAHLLFMASIICFLYGAMTVNVYLFALSDNVKNLTNYIPWGFVNIRYWSHVATWLLPLLPAAAISLALTKYPLWRSVVAIGAGLWWWIVILSMARGTMIALVFGSVVALLLFGRIAWPWLRLLSFQVLLGLVFWFVFSMLVPAFFIEASSISLREVKLNSSGRLPLFVEAWRMSLESFPLGMGAQSWLKHEILTEDYLASHRFGHPHNMYLMWAAEYGWLLLLILFGVMFQVFSRIVTRCNELKAKDDRDPSILVAFTVSVLAAFAHAFVSAVFIAPASMLVGLPVMIFLWALLEPIRDQHATYRFMSFSLLSRAISALVLVGVVMASLIWFREVIDYYQAMREDEAFYQENVPGGLAPRFWFHGNFPRSGELMSPK